MKYQSLLLRARYLVLVLPLFALFSTAQVGCTTSNASTDNYAKEDPKPNGTPGTYGNYDGYDDDGYDTYGYD